MHGKVGALGTGPLSLRANISWTFVGNIVYSASQWVMVVLMARLGDPTMVGQFTLALALTTPVFMFAELQLRGIQATDAKKEFAFATYFSLRLLCVMIAIIAVLSLSYALGYRNSILWVIALVALGKGLDSISNIAFGLFQHHERLDWVSRSMMLNGVLSLIAVGVGLGLTGQLIWGVLGSTVMSAVVLAVLNLPTARRLGYRDFPPGTRGFWFDTSLTNIRKLGLVAFPMGVVMMLGSLNTNIPRYFLELSVGSYELGLFAAIAALLVATNTIVNAIGQAASPRLAAYYAGGNTRAFRSLLIRLLGMGSVLGVSSVVAALLIGGEILRLLYGPEYAGSKNVLVVIMVAGAVSNVGAFFGVAVTAMRQFKIQVPIHLAKIVIAVSLGFFLIDAHGMMGAAWLLALTNTVSALLFGALVAVRLKQPLPKRAVRAQ